MRRTSRIDTGAGLRFHAASSVLLAIAVVGLLLPWEGTVEHVGGVLDLRSEFRTSFDLRPEARSGLEVLLLPVGASGVIMVAAPVVGLALSIRWTRRMAVTRAILAAVGTAPFVFWIAASFAFTGGPPDFFAGWLTFWALIGGFIANVIASRTAGRGRGHPSPQQRASGEEARLPEPPASAEGKRRGASMAMAVGVACSPSAPHRPTGSQGDRA